MKRALQTISRHIQRLALVFLLASFALQPAVLAEASRYAELISTEEVCALTESTVAEVPVRKKIIRAAFVPTTFISATAFVARFKFRPAKPVTTSSLEVFLRKLRI